jgi:hypothetical protein
MLLGSPTSGTADISSEIELLSHTYQDSTGVTPAVAEARLTLAGVDGNGDYQVHFYVNGVLVLPSAAINPDGRTTFTLSSKRVTIIHGDVVSIRAAGLPADTAVTYKALLINAQVMDVSQQEALKDDIIEAVVTQLQSVHVHPSASS